MKTEDAYQRLIIRKENIAQEHCHYLENEIVASQNEKPNIVDRIRYMQLGFLQSEPQIKLERLYIALKEQQLDFSCEQESVLISQTLFEISEVMGMNDRRHTLLEWTVDHNPFLIQKLGLLCIEKARAMQYRLTQHHTIGNILEVALELLTFYPPAYKGEFIKGIEDIYSLLKEVLAEPPDHLSNQTKLYLNAYLIISVQGAPELLKTEILTVLKALFNIQDYKSKAIELDNAVLLRVRVASHTLSLLIESNLAEDPTVLNDLMVNVIPQWDRTRIWQKSEEGLLYMSNEHAVEPLIGGIYFRNQPVEGLPDTITKHPVFQDYLGRVSFAVIPDSCKIDNHTVPCFSSVDNTPQTRLTLIRDALVIEEYIDGDYQRYIPAEELLGHDNYPHLLYQASHDEKILRHWLTNKQQILIKDHERKTVYEWTLESNAVFSLQHQGFVVPWNELQGSAFKTWLERIELADWIEVIAKPNSDNSIQIQSLHFPRLGLHFDLKDGEFYCEQIHGYVLAKEQHINTLHGFLNYLILEKGELNSAHRLIKVVIPHRQVTPEGSFMDKTTVANRTQVSSSVSNILKSPTYFVYDFDPKTGMLKAHRTHAQLYLALLYYCSASLDDHDLSKCNAYHLARENLELCWKDQPFDQIELDIIDQFLSSAAMRDFHINRIALYLKVVSLLSSSLRLAFLHTNQATVQNEEKSNELLDECQKKLPFLLSLYLQNKSTIFARIRLSLDEEEDVIRQCLLELNSRVNGKLEESEKSRITSLIETFQAYCQLNFEHYSQVVLTAMVKRSYKDHYKQLFCKEALNKTLFLNLFQVHLTDFNLEHATEEVNFSSGFDGILHERFCLNNFITLYKLAKSSTVSLLKYRYLLHHMVFRSKENYDRFPAKLVMMLARALLLVAENPTLFPESPDWFGVNKLSVKLPNRILTEAETLQAFPAFYWNPPMTYDTWREEKEAREHAEREYHSENEQIWFFLKLYDLNKCGVPNHLPTNPNYFTLQYENSISFKNFNKREKVRELYLEAAYNDAMYTFFVSVMERCDEHKYSSAIGWSIVPFTDNPITETISAGRFSSPTLEPVSLEKWTSGIRQQSLITFNKFFTSAPQAIQNTDFLFEVQLEESGCSEYQRQFYKELKDSWSAYHKETEVSYSWLNSQSMNELENELQTKYNLIQEEAEQTWDQVIAELKRQPCSESDNYFALRWHSGQVSHYHKGDVLRLLVEPQKLVNYNPNCVEKHDIIIGSVLKYVICEINSAKVVRVLALIKQFKQAENEEEQYSVLQTLVKSLQENIDPASYRYPHWFLFQLENEIIVRENQRELIEAMLNQTEKAMYQLNMGEGKSSVILPLLSHNLADGQKVLRINVLSALLITMKDFLRRRFSGLMRKRIYTLPFHRDTNVSPEHLTLIFQAIQTCQHSRHILLVTPEHRLCLQLKLRELLLENQQQIGATNIFNWQTYRQRVHRKVEVYKNLTEAKIEQLLTRQDEHLRNCLLNEKYIDSNNQILRIPPRGQGRKAFAKFKEAKDQTFREWSCLNAAYCELLYNSSFGHEDSSRKLVLLNKINALTAIDLLDESDEILRHGTELNYTMGDKHLFAGGELRWQVPQFFITAIFCDPELRSVITAGKTDGFTVLNEHFSQRGGVPFVQLLNESYFKTSIKPVLVEKFLSENLPTLRKYEINADNPLVEDKASSLRDYISGQLPLTTERKIMDFLKDKGQLKDKLLIAKGWLSHGILFHVFNAKYRVQYGLNVLAQGQITKPIAIPFMGKDAPSPRSEFSHPDVMLGFTTISYLYEGLDQKQLKDSLIKLKDEFCHQVADAELQKWAEAGRLWIKTDSFPPLLLTSLEHMDLADEQCLEKLHRYLSCNHLAILYYLNQFVLLQEAMQYLFKISANAHSLVGYDAALGFSGTDDKKLTMPYQIKSLRSATQEGTNGKLLSVLTQERNSRYHSLQVEDTNSLLEQFCTYIAQHPHCHALIDAGALVTGLTNYDVAEFLCHKLPANFLGILYFSDDGNTLTVLTRDNRTVAHQDCYLDKQNLFAYLDDIHTRGTDIKLPLNCHAILTISMGMDKDKLMQAAMRLRQLAQKQSVSLWGTQAVTLAIARDNSVGTAVINSSEVIKWVTKNTIEHINDDLFPVAVRKINFQFLKKAEAWLKEAPTALNSLVRHCQEKELFLLEEFYGLSPQREDLADRLYCLMTGKIRAFWQEIENELEKKQLLNLAFHKKVFTQLDKKKFRKMLEDICNEFADFLETGYIHSNLNNDEEKEVEVEIIQEQEVLVKVEGREAYLEETWDVRLILQRDFIKMAKENGTIRPLSMIKHFVRMPVNLKNVTWHDDVYMTENFIRTVKCKDEVFDNYLRPVDVILIHRLQNKTSVILLSGHEAARIKALCYHALGADNLLIHLYDVDRPTQLPLDSAVSKQEQKLLTIVKLFSGECHYPVSSEAQRLAKRVGRLYPDYFSRFNSSVNDTCAQKLFGILIEEGYLDSSGTMTKKLLKILDKIKSEESPSLELMNVSRPHCQLVAEKLCEIFTKLIIRQSCSLREEHTTLSQWIGTRGRLKEYRGSMLESILNPEYELKYYAKSS